MHTEQTPAEQDIEWCIRECKAERLPQPNDYTMAAFIEKVGLKLSSVVFEKGRATQEARQQAFNEIIKKRLI